MPGTGPQYISRQTQRSCGDESMSRNVSSERSELSSCCDVRSQRLSKSASATCPSSPAPPWQGHSPSLPSRWSSQGASSVASTSPTWTPSGWWWPTATRVEDIPVPADFSQRGYYLTLMANRLLYPGNQPGNQLRVLRVGNDTRCSPKTRGCNHPLPGPGPYRVKFLVMSDRGPVAETEWSSETRLQQAKALQAVPGPQSAGTVVIIAILSVLLAVLFTALLALLIYTCHDTCRSAPISGPEQSTCVRRYNTHHVTDPPAVGAS
ncbi:uroplakin-3b-like protein 2 isoform X2 [Acinonyx jubatus]|uniref:Uroplakin-3b-like protein 2 isoform X2 n=2 Tax=Acinonyx jubatus TaxID=32536 RepID=A0A6J1XZY3_ACIJB|nr:uroplakin-3b-like protein 2 isoform X2 [Acinonyx jubatus]